MKKQVKANQKQAIELNEVNVGGGFSLNTSSITKIDTNIAFQSAGNLGLDDNIVPGVAPRPRG